MITKIGVQGFKALQDVELELGAVNVVIGANGVGKSSLLEAIGVLGAAVGGRVDAESLHRRGVRLGQPAIYKTSLAEQDYRRSISLSAYGEPEVGYHVSLSNPVKRPEPVWKYDTESLEVEGRRVAGRSPRGSRAPEVGTLKEPLSREAGLITALMAHFRPSVRSFLQVLGDYRIFAPTTPVLRGVAQDSAPVPPLGLSGGDLAERVGELLEDEAKGERLLDLIHRLIPWVEDARVVAPATPLIPPALPMPRRIPASSPSPISATSSCRCSTETGRMRSRSFSSATITLPSRTALRGTTMPAWPGPVSTASTNMPRVSGGRSPGRAEV